MGGRRAKQRAHVGLVVIKDFPTPCRFHLHAMHFILTHRFDPRSCFVLSPHLSLAFGALISSVDPVAVIAVMNSLGVSPTEPLYVMIFGEALLNDGVAVVLFDTVVDFFKEDVEVDQSDFVYAFLNFIKVFFGSAAIGFVQGLLMTFYFRWMDKKMGALVETLQFFLSALLTYYICDSWGGSGICGIVVTGVMADIYTMQHLSEGAWVWGGLR